MHEQKNPIIVLTILLTVLLLGCVSLSLFMQNSGDNVTEQAEGVLSDDAGEEMSLTGDEGSGDGSTTEQVLVPVEQETRELPAEQQDPSQLEPTYIDVSTLKETDRDVYGFYKQDQEYMDFMDEIGAKVVHIPEYTSYFVYWVPKNWDELNEKRAMVLLHGSSGTAYSRIKHLYETAQKEGFALISVQWGWPAPGDKDAYAYLHDTEDGLKVVYHMMTLGLDYLELHYGLDKQLSAWNGFSRGSSASIAYAYFDTDSGNDYFKMFMGIAGPLLMGNDLVASLVSEEMRGELDGTNMYLWCGTDNLNTDEFGNTFQTCDRVEKDVQALGPTGANIEFVKTEGGVHSTWNNDAQLQIEAVDLWRQY